jgi:hypothetical protein
MDPSAKDPPRDLFSIHIGGRARSARRSAPLAAAGHDGLDRLRENPAKARRSGVRSHLAGRGPLGQVRGGGTPEAASQR